MAEEAGFAYRNLTAMDVPHWLDLFGEAVSRSPIGNSKGWSLSAVRKNYG